MQRKLHGAVGMGQDIFADIEDNAVSFHCIRLF